MKTHVKSKQFLVAFWGLMIVGLLAACAPPPPVADLKTTGLTQLQLKPVTIADVAMLPSEQVRVAQTVTQILSEQLQQRGYEIVQSAGDGTLTVHIDYVRDERLHRTYYLYSNLYPELEIYATFELLDANGKRLAKDDVIARGNVPDIDQTGMFAFLEPQINLARKISSRFPVR